MSGFTRFVLEKLHYIWSNPQNLCFPRPPRCSKRDPRSQPPITLHHSLALRPFVRRRQMVVRFSLTDGFAHKSGLSRKQQLFFPPRHTGGHCPVVKPALRMVRRRPNHSHTHLLSYATKPNQTSLTLKHMKTKRTQSFKQGYFIYLSSASLFVWGRLMTLGKS